MLLNQNKATHRIARSNTLLLHTLCISGFQGQKEKENRQHLLRQQKRHKDIRRLLKERRLKRLWTFIYL